MASNVNIDDSTEDFEGSMSCCSSNFEIDSPVEDDVEGFHVAAVSGIEPYMFEPVVEVGVEVGDNAEAPAVPGPQPADRFERLQNTEWCTCELCTALPLAEECTCCQEMEKVKALMDTHNAPLGCITEHPGFEAVCLNVWVLQTAFYSFRQYHRHAAAQINQWTINERFRYVAYRQFVRWCWGYLGEKHRVVLPSCVVTKIRSAFPSADYVGFQYPQLEN